jgi:two-component system response regulator HupR/HoxA
VAEAALAPLPCLLVVDDEPLNRDLLRRTLKRDFEVVEAEDAREAMVVLGERDDVALVLCDQLMPGRSGTELAREVRAMRPALPFVLLTGYDDDPDVTAARTSGFVAAVVAKPWQAPALRGLVARLLGK